jgi:hypothetical protein
MDTQTAWNLRDVVNIAAIIIGPIVAVVITLWWQDRKEKRAAKMRIFTTLMALRKSIPIRHEWVNSLNLIDVVFADCPEVVNRWQEYYSLLQRPQPSPQEQEGQLHKYVELMSAMADSLGFANLSQVAIEKFYVPQAHGMEAEMNAQILVESLRVLQNTERVLLVPKGQPKEDKGNKPRV